ncbi:unnamed protein product [Bursaphelenchus okinawaensis]|uniref:Uncharacterized protein n=1 Tax=Bursaphelenchus okinawaensis TaxID=465554 RepID=A0A811LQE8_9BILA|nr:unnamed protein product [Bursaphelenchus okinawaensis]CAG9127304.1 unnamed protein product [Bursaphelenchus okinawaensis]
MKDYQKKLPEDAQSFAKAKQGEIDKRIKEAPRKVKKLSRKFYKKFVAIRSDHNNTYNEHVMKLNRVLNEPDRQVFDKLVQAEALDLYEAVI